MTLIAMHNLDEIRNELNAIEKDKKKVHRCIKLITRINKRLNVIKSQKLNPTSYARLSDAIKKDYKKYSNLSEEIQDVLHDYIDMPSFLYFSCYQDYRTLVDRINNQIKKIKILDYDSDEYQSLSNAIKEDYKEFLGLDENIKNMIRQMIDIKKFTEISRPSSSVIRPIIKPSIKTIDSLKEQIENSKNPILKALIEDSQRLFETSKGKELTSFLSQYQNEKSTDTKNNIMDTIIKIAKFHRHPFSLFRPKYATTYQNFMIAKFQMEFNVDKAFEELPRNQKFLIALYKLDEKELSTVERSKARTIINKNKLEPTKKDSNPAPNSTPSPSSK